MSVQLTKRRSVVAWGIFFLVLFLSTGDAYAVNYLTAKKKPVIRRTADALKIDASFAVGVDSNVNLTPKAKSDIFEEGMVKVGYSFDLVGGIKSNVSYQLYSHIYNEVNEHTVLDNIIRFDFSKKIRKNLALKICYIVEPVIYPNSNQSQYLKLTPRVTLIHFFNQKIYQKFKYSYNTYDHSKRMIYNTIGNELDEERFDKRHDWSYHLGMFINKKHHVSMKFGYDVNDSNEEFQAFYDYSRWKMGFSFLSQLTDRLSFYGALNIYYRNYDARRIIGKDEKQDDTSYSSYLFVSYKMTEQFFLEGVYNFRNNQSNEPTSRYTSNMVSLGVRYSY